LTRSIVIAPYDPSWPAAFRSLRDLVVQRLGARVAEVHHVGSTAIPGLDAKPKIDVDAVLTSDAIVPDAAERLKAFGYESHGDVYRDGMWCLTKSHGAFGERLYLCGPGNRVHAARLRFRDYLATHGEMAAAYAALKRRLAAESAGDWARYNGGKAEFVAEVLRLAEAPTRAMLRG
jgi:GrpB-like predicted nucleotidyltransferase (UPF0157 family)